ncbi:MAG: hypothetical protein R3C97_14855 [Geminicoccaceae bacterium]
MEFPESIFLNFEIIHHLRGPALRQVFGLGDDLVGFGVFFFFRRVSRFSAQVAWRGEDEAYGDEKNALEDGEE